MVTRKRIAIAVGVVALAMAVGLVSMFTPIFAGLRRPGPVPLAPQNLSSDGLELVFFLGCPERPRLTAQETDDEVIITYEAIETTNLCLLTDVIVLAAPLGDRLVRDATSGLAYRCRPADEDFEFGVCTLDGTPFPEPLVEPVPTPFQARVTPGMQLLIDRFGDGIVDFQVDEERAIIVVDGPVADFQPGVDEIFGDDAAAIKVSGRD